MIDFNALLPNRSTWILERTLWKQGVKYIVGIDEVGKGALAGPLVVAAVILPVGCKLLGLRDSKILTAPMRAQAFKRIIKGCVDYSIVSASNEEIDTEGILNVNRRLFHEVIERLMYKDFVAVDGRAITRFPYEHAFIIDGDARVKSISAASIVAKVYRDRLMEHYSRDYQNYKFATHKGYGTLSHLKAIDQHGPCPIHRKSFLIKYHIRKNRGSLI